MFVFTYLFGKREAESWSGMMLGNLLLLSYREHLCCLVGLLD